ncbi:MAG: hypothetical protein EAZ36_03700, partial [Verrucomicrobia bacterium]
KRMEYRGYDSAGVCTVHDGQLVRRRAEGKGKTRERRGEGGELPVRLSGADEAERGKALLHPGSAKGEARSAPFEAASRLNLPEARWTPRHACRRRFG